MPAKPPQPKNYEIISISLTSLLNPIKIFLKNVSYSPKTNITSLTPRYQSIKLQII